MVTEPGPVPESGYTPSQLVVRLDGKTEMVQGDLAATFTDRVVEAVRDALGTDRLMEDFPTERLAPAGGGTSKSTVVFALIGFPRSSVPSIS
jgi:hypothetical protein